VFANRENMISNWIDELRVKLTLRVASAVLSLTSTSISINPIVPRTIRQGESTSL